MTIKNFSQRISLLFLFVLLSGCSQATDIYSKEADAICDLYSPINMQSTVSMELLVKYEYVNTRLRETVRSPAMRGTFEKLAREGNPDFYGSLQQEISALIGKPWSCNDARDFYATSWQRVVASNTNVVIEVSIVDGKFYVIDDKNYDLADVESIKNVFDTIANGQAYKIQLNVPSATQHDSLNQYLEPLRIIGVKEVSVLEIN